MLFKNKSNLSQTAQLCLLALFIALRILGGSIKIPLGNNIFLGVTFVFIMLESMIFEYKWVVISAAIGDIITALIFPIGAFDPLFTLLAIYQTSIYWFGLHNKRISALRLFLVKLFNNVTANIVLTPLLVYITKSSDISTFMAKWTLGMVSRVPKNLILLPFEVILAFVVLRMFKPLLTKTKLVDEKNLTFKLF